MPPQGQYTRSRYCALITSIAVVMALLISIATFREELLSAIQKLGTSSQCHCPTTPAVAPLSSAHKEHHGHHVKQRPTVQTTFTDLTILEELPNANVLWVNKTSATEAWGLSMFHALHCVKMWKESLDPATMMSSHVHSESEYAEHAGHCISYLVQSIVCAADDTIEPAEDIVVGDKHGKRIHGMGYQHQCRDTGFLFEMNGKRVDLWDWNQGDTLNSVFS